MPVSLLHPIQVSQPAFPDPIPGIIPFGSLNLMSGASGSGKSTFYMEWIARLASGRSICGYPTHPATGYYILTADRPWAPTYAALAAAAGTTDLVKHYSLVEDNRVDPDAWNMQGTFKILTACLNKLNPIPGSLVFIDPVAPLFIKGDQNRSRDVATSLHRYRREIADRQITMIALTNIGKQRQDDASQHKRPQDRISGSGSFTAYSDTQIYVVDAEDPSDPESPTLMGWTPRLAPAAEYPFVRDPKTHLFVPARSGDMGQSLQTACMERMTYILQALTNDEAGAVLANLAKSVMRHFKISKATFYRDVTQLAKDELVTIDETGMITRRKVS